MTLSTSTAYLRVVCRVRRLPRPDFCMTFYNIRYKPFFHSWSAVFPLRVHELGMGNRRRLWRGNCRGSTARLLSDLGLRKQERGPMLDDFFVFTHSFWQPIRGNRGSQVGTDPPSHSHLWGNAVIYTYFSNLVSQWSWCAAAAETTSRTRSSSTGNASGRRAAGHVRPVTWLREERV